MAEQQKAEMDQFKTVAVQREGDKIVLPLGMSYEEGMRWLERMRQQDEQKVNLFEVVEASPLDGAQALMIALREKYGWTSLVPTPGFFGSNPPTLIGVETGVGETRQIAWGRIQVPNVDGHFDTQAHKVNGQYVFVMAGVTKQRHAAEMKALADAVRHVARTQSIYRARAIRVSFPDPHEDYSIMDHQPKFIDTRAVHERDLIFPADVERMVQTTLFTPIRYTQACANAGVPLKRGVLLEGPWGTGKTLTAYVTAKLATEHNWTFIYLHDVSRLPEALQFARQYQPAVVFAEDIDRADVDGARTDGMNDILNTIDGIEFKSAQIITVLTTNHLENITQAMLRPGRLDAVIPVRAPDAEAAARLVRSFAGVRLDPAADLARVGRVLDGQIPASIREVVERSKLAAVARTGSASFLLTAQDLETAAEGMVAHLQLLAEKPNDTRTAFERGCDTLAAALTTTAQAPFMGRPNGHVVRGIASVAPLAALGEESTIGETVEG